MGGEEVRAVYIHVGYSYSGLADDGIYFPVPQELRGRPDLGALDENHDGGLDIRDKDCDDDCRVNAYLGLFDSRWYKDKDSFLDLVEALYHAQKAYSTAFYLGALSGLEGTKFDQPLPCSFPIDFLSVAMAEYYIKKAAEDYGWQYDSKFLTVRKAGENRSWMPVDMFTHPTLAEADAVELVPVVTIPLSQANQLTQPILVELMSKWDMVAALTIDFGNLQQCWPQPLYFMYMFKGESIEFSIPSLGGRHQRRDVSGLEGFALPFLQIK